MLEGISPCKFYSDWILLQLKFGVVLVATVGHPASDAALPAHARSERRRRRPQHPRALAYAVASRGRVARARSPPAVAPVAACRRASSCRGACPPADLHEQPPKRSRYNSIGHGSTHHRSGSGRRLAVVPHQR
ncbi:hypothetical protein SEVIR_9G492175v4 [Setaria viridis]